MSAWRIHFFVAETAIQAVQTALDPFCEAVAAFEFGPGVWRIDAYAVDAPDRADLTARLAIATASVGVSAPEPWILAVEDEDWAMATAQAFPPIRIGRFVIHGGHAAPPPRGTGIPLQIEAGAAFGTGEHATTALCLRAIQQLAKRRPLGDVLDIGCGTGVLALGALRLGARRAVGVDLDPRSARSAQATARVNGLAARARFFTGDGFTHPAIRAGRPYDLFLGNILVRPLVAMAPLARHFVRPGGFAVLSGLIPAQVPWLESTWRRCGFARWGHLQDRGWSAVVMRRMRRPRG